MCATLFVCVCVCVACVSRLCRRASVILRDPCRPVYRVLCVRVRMRDGLTPVCVGCRYVCSVLCLRVRGVRVTCVSRLCRRASVILCDPCRRVCRVLCLCVRVRGVCVEVVSTCQCDPA